MNNGHNNIILIGFMGSGKTQRLTFGDGTNQEPQ